MSPTISPVPLDALDVALLSDLGTLQHVPQTLRLNYGQYHSIMSSNSTRPSTGSPALGMDCAFSDDSAYLVTGKILAMS